MKFKVSEDVDAPRAMVWARLTDFTAMEQDARGRGAKVTRVGNWHQTAEGVEWRGEVIVRGKIRPLAAQVTRYMPEDLCLIESRIGGMACVYEMSFVALTPEVTRVAVVLDLSAQTLTARLVLQTMKLARGRVIQKIEGALARQGNAVEAEYRKTKGA